VTRNQRRHVDLVAAGVAVFASLVSAGAQRPAGPLAPERIDYLTFAQGAVPIAVRGAGAKLGASFDQAIRAVDGDPAGFVLTLKPGDAATDIEFIYHPARAHAVRPVRDTERARDTEPIGDLYPTD
jgi:hypothetical protein